jgi:hypothetical protein
MKTKSILLLVLILSLSILALPLSELITISPVHISKENGQYLFDTNLQIGGNDPTQSITYTPSLNRILSNSTSLTKSNSSAYAFTLNSSKAYYVAYFKNDSDVSKSARAVFTGNYIVDFDIAVSQCQWYSSKLKAVMSNPANPQHSKGVASNNTMTYPNAWAFTTPILFGTSNKTSLTYALNVTTLDEVLKIGGVPSNVTWADYWRYRVDVYYNSSLTVQVNGVNYLHPSNVMVNTTGRINFYSGGSLVFYIPAPIVRDSSGNVVNGTYFLDMNNGVDLWYLAVPYSFLKTATFPIYLDPSTISYSSGTIKVVGYTSASPCTFYNVWNASNTNNWKVVWNNRANNTQYQFDANLQIGNGTYATYFADSGKQVYFINDMSIIVKAYADFRIGKIYSRITKATYAGCSLYYTIDGSESYAFIEADYGLSDVEIYSSQITNLATVTGTIIGDSVATGQPNCTIWNSIVSGKGNPDFELLNSSSSLYNDIACVGSPVFLSCYCSVSTFYAEYNTIVMAATGSYSGTLSNIVGTNVTQAFSTIGTGVTGSPTLLDCVFNKWAPSFGANTIALYRKYSFNLAMTYPNDTAMNGANVTITDYGQGKNQFGTWLTNSTGQVATQLTMIKYNKTKSSGYNYNPYNLAVTYSGSLVYSKNFTLSATTNWEVCPPTVVGKYPVSHQYSSSVSQSSSTSSLAQRTFAALRFPTLSLSFSLSLARLLQGLRTASLSLNILTSITRVLSVNRPILQAITLNTQSARMLSSSRTASVSSALSFQSSRTFLASRQTLQAASLSIMVSRVLSSSRQLTQPLVLAFSTSRTASLSRSTSSSPQLSILSERTYFSTRSINQIITVSSLPSRLSIIVRVTEEKVTLFLSSERFVSYQRLAPQNVTLSLQTSRQLQLTRATEQTFIPTFNSSRLLQLTRTTETTVSLSLQEFSMYLPSIPITPPVIIPPIPLLPLHFDVAMKLPSYLIFQVQPSFHATVTLTNTVNQPAEVQLYWWITSQNGQTTADGIASTYIQAYANKTIQLYPPTPTKQGNYTFHVNVKQPEGVQISGVTTQTFQVYGVASWLIGPGLFYLAIILIAVTFLIAVVWFRRRRF